MLETEVINVNWSAKSFTYRTLGNQLKSLHYDYLVLAMGLRSRQLPSSFPGSQLRSIFYVRSLEDASRLVSKRETWNTIRVDPTNSRPRSRHCARDEECGDYRRFVHRPGVLRLANDGFTGEEKCFRGDERQITDVSCVKFEDE